MTGSCHVVINRKAGTANGQSEPALDGDIRQALGERLASLHFVEGAELPDCLTGLAAGDPRPILIGGGDGSVTMAAQTLLSLPRPIPFGILPFGTMNLMARDLGIPVDFREALAAYRASRVRKIDVGRVNGDLFLCSAVLGIVPEAAVAREQLRDKLSLPAISDYLSVIARGFSPEGVMKIKLSRGDNSISLRTSTFVVANNHYTEQPQSKEDRLRRDTLDGGQLGIYAAKLDGALDGFSLAIDLWKGTWQDNDSVLSFHMPDLSVTCEEKNAMISLDGEPKAMKSPLEFSIERQVLPVLVPA